MVRQVVLSLWFVACVAVLAWFFLSGAPDVHVAFGFALALLTFPIGVAVLWLWGGVLWLLDSGFGLDLPREFTVLLWLAAVGAGYWQWFRWVPQLLRKFRRDP